MVCKCWIPFSSFFPGPQTGSKERPSSLKGPCQGPCFPPHLCLPKQLQSFMPEHGLPVLLPKALSPQLCRAACV